MKKVMKRTAVLIAVMMALTACGGSNENTTATSETVIETVEETTQEDIAQETSSNGLMQGASPNSSALSFYSYDGEMIYRSIIYDNIVEQKILDELDCVKGKEADNWTVEDITFPVYGFWIGSVDGTSIYPAWSNDYWIAQDGRVYDFEFDFAELEQTYFNTERDEVTSINSFPCARFLTQDKDAWNSTLLPSITELNPPDDIIMTLEDLENDCITVNIKNENSTTWYYGEHYSLHVLLDDMWYEIPAMPGSWSFPDVGYGLRSKGEASQTYNLTMYGELPVGTYRIVVNELSVEFVIS